MATVLGVGSAAPTAARPSDPAGPTESVADPGAPALPAGPDVPGVTSRVSNWRFGPGNTTSTTTLRAVPAGATAIPVRSTTGFPLGATVLIGPTRDPYVISDLGGSTQMYLRTGVIRAYAAGVQVILAVPLVSFQGVVSGNGAFVAYTSQVRTLARGSTTALADIYLYRRSDRSTRRISSASVRVGTTTAVLGAGAVHAAPTVGGDGQVVAWAIRATTAGGGSLSIVGAALTPVTFIAYWDSATNRVTGVALGTNPSIDEAGRRIAFETTQALSPTDTNELSDIYVYDRIAKTFALASLPDGGASSAGRCRGPALSPDARYVSFTCDAALTANDRNKVADVYLRDLQARRTTLVSVESGRRGSAAAGASSVARGGRYVVFDSASPNLVANDTNGQIDVFLRDMTTGRTTLVSRGFGGDPANALSNAARISGNGRFIAFTSVASNLVPNDTNGGAVATGAATDAAFIEIARSDVFVFDRVGGRTTRASISSAGQQSAGGGFMPSISTNGRFLAFSSPGSDLVAGDDNRSIDVFIRDRRGQLQVNPVTIAFPAVSVGSMSGFQNVTVTNVGVAPMAVGAPTLAGLAPADFLVDPSTCRGVTLYPGETCQVRVRFRPRAAGDRSAAMAVPQQGTTSGPAVALVAGGLQPVVQVQPATLEFGAGVITVAGSPQIVSVANAGSGSLRIVRIAVVGANPGDYVVDPGTCGSASLAAGTSCALTIRLRPTGFGDRPAQLEIADGSGKVTRVSLTGAGLQPILEVSPQVGPAGVVVIARGTAFPPGRGVPLHWDPGLSEPSLAGVPDSTGSFTVQVLVFPHDRRGARELVAFVGLPGLREVRAPFTVTFGTTGPPGVRGPVVNPVGPGRTLIMRR